MVNVPKIWRWCWLLACSLALWAAPARAGIAVSPLKQEISVHPGETGKLTVNLAYNAREVNDAPQGLRLSVTDVQVAEDGTLAFPEAGSRPNSASKWITLSQTEATLEAGQTQAVEFTIAPPLNTPPGEYYATVMVTLGKAGRTEKGLTVQYRVASGVFVTVLGRTFTHQAKITRCELAWPPDPAAIPPAMQPTTAPATQPAEPEQPRVEVVLHNTGQARFDGSGKVVFLDSKSRLALSATLTSKRPTVFAGDSRLFEAFLSKPLPAGHYRLRIEMDYESPWSKAHQEIPLDILPEQAAQLAAARTHHQEASGGLEFFPEKFKSIIPAGATRSLALTLRNISDAALPCRTAAAAPPPPELVELATGPNSADPSWFTVSPAEFTIIRSGRQSVEVKIHVPADVRTGTYAGIVTLNTAPEGAPPAVVQIPLEVLVKGVGP